MSNQDHDVLRGLATRWMELASLPVMADRRRQWTALKDLRAERPMVLFETWTLENYVAEDELACDDAELRRVEKGMRALIRQAEEIGDDYRGRAVPARLLGHRTLRLRRAAAA